ncbi:CoA-binding protein [Saccharopolyspora taberi]|uniref:CoA-binding protein n=1 Tax=Saccharopolyspora taberi TaxID=60895 RepID=A0ABN3VEM4_9PSEU
MTAAIPRQATEPTAKQRLAILRAAKSVAIVGFSANIARASYFVATYLLQDAGYRLHFVNPRAAGQQVLGLPVHASLADLPETPDIVDVFRKASDLPGVVDETVAIGAPVLWVQLGIINEEAAADARARGLTAVTNRCLKIEHARFHGGLHLAGFNTGQITARRTLR